MYGLERGIYALGYALACERLERLGVEWLDAKVAKKDTKEIELLIKAQVILIKKYEKKIRKERKVK